MSANIKEIPWDGVYWIYLALDTSSCEHSNKTWRSKNWREVPRLPGQLPAPRGIVLLCICLSAP